ncbi:delta-1-pyrroline-5-carboxylate synthase-like [Clytia hemisphaerica]
MLRSFSQNMIISNLNKMKASHRHISCLPILRAKLDISPLKKASMPMFRDQLKNCNRIVVKMGSAVITREDETGVALGRLAAIVEQVSELQNVGKEMMIITSGAVAFGRQTLRNELSMQQTMRDSLKFNTRRMGFIDSRACAAVGQGGLLSLYEEMFNQYGLTVAQVLLTKPDLQNNGSRANLRATMEELIRMNCVPIINANDAVVPPLGPEVDLAGMTPWTKSTLALKDNDSLAALLAVEMNADLLVILSDVDGIYTAPPKEEHSRLLSIFRPSDKNLVRFGASDSKVGTGGMESKVNASLYALEGGTSVVIANGQFKEINTVNDIVNGKKIGTFFTYAERDIVPIEDQAVRARAGSKALANLTPNERAQIIQQLAELIQENHHEILTANQKDMEAARRDGTMAASLISRLALTPQKLNVLTEGLRQIAESSKNILGRPIRATRVGDGLDLHQITVPIGVLLVIFESRPDCLPQVAALSIASGNGLLLKGGKEAKHSNEFLQTLVEKALSLHGVNCSGAITLVDSKDEVSDLLRMKEHIDLVIPRGSSEMIANIKEQSKDIPVLGHAEGICHVFVDRDADMETAVRVVIDSKCNYPAACNAMETLLVDKTLFGTTAFDELLQALKNNNVKAHAGPRLSRELPFGPVPAHSLRKEYSDMECAIELVENVDDAIKHIENHGSSHTDSIITENEATASKFLKNVDSACVFHNASTRFADGYRFGLGAEVGISTTKIHARGPVGVEGLLTTKWVLKGHGHCVTDFGEGGQYQYIHQELDTGA